MWTVRNGKLVDVPASTQGSVSAEPPPPGQDDNPDMETDPATGKKVPKGSTGSSAAPAPVTSTTVPASQVPSGPPQGAPVPGTGTVGGGGIAPAGAAGAGGVTTNAPMIDNGDGTFTDPSTGKRYPGHRSADVIGTRPDGSVGFVPGPIIITGTPIGGAAPRSGGGADPNFNPNNPPPVATVKAGGHIFAVTPGIVQPDGTVSPPVPHDLGPDPDAPASKNVSADTQARIDADKQKNLDDLAYQYAALQQQGRIADAQNLLQKGVALGIIDGQPTLDAIIRKADIALKTGDLTGIYNGQSTVAAGAQAGFVTLPNGQRVPTAQSTQAAGYVQLPDGTRIPTLAQGEATGMITLPDGRQVPSLRAGEDVGTVNGQPTLARGQLMGELNGVPTWQKQKDVADITGYYGGNPTMQRDVYGAQYGGQWGGQPTVQVGQMLGRWQGQNTLERDVQEAQSRRADVATNLARQGQGWEQWMKERQDTEELGRNPQDWLSYAIRAGGGQVPQGVGLWDQLQRVNANRPENVESFLNRQNQAPAKQAGAVPGTAAPAAAPAPAPAPVPSTAAGAPPAPGNPTTVLTSSTATSPVPAGALAPTSLVPNPVGSQQQQNMGTDRPWHDLNAAQAIGIYDLGGTVPGTPDQHTLGILQGGEQVLPPQAQQGVVQQNFYPGPIPTGQLEQVGGGRVPPMQQAAPPPIRYDMPPRTPPSPLDTGYGPAQPGRTAGVGSLAPAASIAPSSAPSRIGAMNNFAAPPTGPAPTNLSATVGGAGAPAGQPQPQGQANRLPTAGDFRNLPFLPAALRAAITPVGGATGPGGMGGNRWNGAGVSPYAQRYQGGFRPVAAQAARSLNPSFIPALGTIGNQTGNLSQDMPWWRKSQ